MKSQMMKTKIVLGILIFLANIAAIAQTMPTIKPIKGPEAAAIDKIIDMPVSNYTGIPNISIPLYEISIKGVSVPISLNYNGAGGIKVDEEATMVGLGWRLNYGGTVSRSLKGKPDERCFFEKQSLDQYFQLPAYEDDISQGQRTEFVFNAKNPGTANQIDLIPDEFYYSAEGYSGKFMYKQNAGKFILFPKEDVVIKYNRGVGANSTNIDTWDITIPNGTKYSFGGDGTSKSNTIPPTPTPLTFDQLPTDNMWSVKKITTTNSEIISYSYFTNTYTSFSRSTNEYYDFQTQFINNLPPRTQSSLKEPIIQSITFPNGSISFTLSDRVDLPSKKVDEMIIKNSSNKVIKKIKFFYSYFYGDYGYVKEIYRLNSTSDLDNKRLRLDSISVIDDVTALVQSYRFNYYTGDGRLPSKYSYAQDCWGYFNGAANTTWVPKLLPAITNGADRKVNNAVNNVFALKSITYPTAGKTEFTYEGNVAKTVGHSDFNNMLYGSDYVNETVSLTIGSSSPSAIMNGENYYYKTFTVLENGGYPAPNGWSCLFGASIGGAPADPTCSINYAIFKLEKLISPGTYQPVESYKYCNGMNPPIQTKSLNRLLPGDYRVVIVTKFPPVYTQNGSLSGLKVSITWGNYTPNANSSMNVGGLRIREIKYINSDEALLKKKTYAYLDDEGYTSGSIYSAPQYFQYQINLGTTPQYGAFLRAYGNPIEPFQTISGSYMGYSKVKEEVVDPLDPLNNLVTKYTYSYVYPIYAAYAAPNIFLDGLVEPREWQYGKLLNVDYLKKGTVIKKEEYNYPLKNPNEDFVDGILVNHISWASLNNILGHSGSQQIADFTDNYYTDGTDGAAGSPPFGSGFKFFYGVKYSTGSTNDNPVFSALVLPYMKYYTGFDKIQSKTTTVYDGGTPVVQTENFFYEKMPDHHQLTKTEVKDSKNQILQQQYFYPTDFLTDPVYLKMSQLNMKSLVVKQENYKNGVFLNSQKSNYFDWGINIIAPKTIESKVQTNAVETRFQYNAYDGFGNVLNLNSTNASPVSYLFGYKGQYPIAEIRNADYTAIVTALGGATAVNNFANSTPANKAAIDAFLAPIRNSTTTFKNAQVTSYSYIPLVGVSTVTDPKGMVTSYEYDGFQRLQSVKDQNGNIVKNYDYHYKP